MCTPFKRLFALLEKARELAYCLTAFNVNRSFPKTTYAQSQEDIVVEYLIGKVSNFIDIGASDGIGGSNTFLLALKGARGILFEPLHSSFIRLKLLYLFKHNIKCIEEGISDRSTILSLYQNIDGSALKETVNLQHMRLTCDNIESLAVEKVKVNTLTYWLSRYYEFRNTDLISIDVEDHELNVLRGIDFDILRTKCFIIETHGISTNEDVRTGGYLHKDYNEIHDILRKEGYVAVLKNSTNTFWLRHDIIDENKINEIILKFKGYGRIANGCSKT